MECVTLGCERTTYQHAHRRMHMQCVRPCVANVPRINMHTGECTWSMCDPLLRTYHI